MADTEDREMMNRPSLTSFVLVVDHFWDGDMKAFKCLFNFFYETAHVRNEKYKEGKSVLERLVDCIHWTSAAQVSLLEDEIRRVERVIKVGDPGHLQSSFIAQKRPIVIS
ncbi:hypothetical protein V2J09_016432 [Rumex salicifolius]